MNLILEIKHGYGIKLLIMHEQNIEHNRVDKGNYKHRFYLLKISFHRNDNNGFTAHIYI